ncbi:DUF1501 domain-containing protein [Thalassoroseus pseudoceratinae]|uniref:DUF1501 domain-containing protein n=1 Tax=Thalassoroseus pseudoceratinae TaxID=2713176 RepID=UPI001423FC28|nr:DUF1501 domain-containing protein [Thalassoroseus pseudoceratinae]
MLLKTDGRHPIPRREFLRLGSLGIGGLALPSLLADQVRANPTTSSVTGKSVIFLFQQGGPSQFETFDPKPNAPSAIRTVTDVVQTSLPGVEFGEPMSQLARLAHKLTVVRAFQTQNAGHNIQPIVGPHSEEANIGSHFSRVVGTTNPETGMPTNTVIYPNAVESDVPGPQARGDLRSTGPYGQSFAPFVPGGGGDLQQDMKLSLPHDRFFEDRRNLLAQLDRLQRNVDRTGQLEHMDQLQRQAYDLLLDGKVAAALDLANEDPKVIERYDTAQYVPKHNWHKAARGRRGYYTGQAKSIGKLLLLARRLCEAGCGFVTIHAGYAGVWDMHADGNNLNMVDGMDAVGRPFDHAVAAFVEDLESRGLQDKIMLVCTGEMGRTPRINKRGGRDHWSRLAPLLLYGGGLPGGEVIGRSTRDGGEPDGEPFGPSHLISTILNTVFDLAQLRLVAGVAPQVVDLASKPAIHRTA